MDNPLGERALLATERPLNLFISMRLVFQCMVNVDLIIAHVPPFLGQLRTSHSFTSLTRTCRFQISPYPNQRFQLMSIDLSQAH